LVPEDIITFTFRTDYTIPSIDVVDTTFTLVLLFEKAQDAENTGNVEALKDTHQHVMRPDQPVPAARPECAVAAVRVLGYRTRRRRCSHRSGFRSVTTSRTSSRPRRPGPRGARVVQWVAQVGDHDLFGDWWRRAVPFGLLLAYTERHRSASSVRNGYGVPNYEKQLADAKRKRAWNGDVDGQDPVHGEREGATRSVSQLERAFTGSALLRKSGVVGISRRAWPL